MAIFTLPFSWNLLSPTPVYLSSSTSFKTLNLKVFCSDRSGIQQIEPATKKRKPRPSFVDQIHEKWSVQNVSQREKFPWQQKIEEEEEEKGEKSYQIGDNESSVSDSVSFDSRNRVIVAPWIQKNKATHSEVHVEEEVSENTKTVPSVSAEIPKDYDFEAFKDEFDSSEVDKRLPWKKEKIGDRMKAEKLIPEFELKRLRNIALRMLERIKVGAAGINEALVKSVHEKWKESEIVKLKFEGPCAVNMRRTHELLENRTGGLVIWRSGGSVVLFRGMAYNLQCVQSYSQLMKPTTEEPQPSQDLAVNEKKDLNESSKEESTDSSELNRLLDELGPRYTDWIGRGPIPVDADLLPPVVQGYRCPFRLLPYGAKKSLRDKEMTYFRQSARITAPHFILGRNRQLEGLATAMVKLWHTSAIAKIAIKRGVQNTNNERMAEELKRLTGGTLVSRNKEYIVFYRGNDFLPHGITKKLVESQKEAALIQDEEDRIREVGLTLMDSKVNPSNSRLVAGTLSETLAATSRWANELSTEERQKMMREQAVARHASLVRFVQKKLHLARGKVKKAEDALRKVQKNLEPSELPSDLETLTDEERFLFRKVGLSMKPFLLLGRRGVFDGTVENMHLHWRYRELVKIIVEGKSFAQVKHVAISLEAESGGVLVSVDKTFKGYSILIYRGKNYKSPKGIRPKNLLTRRQALARSIELQRREALKYHIWKLEEEMENLKSELEEMKMVDEIDEQTLYSRIDNASDDDDDLIDDELSRSEIEDQSDQEDEEINSVISS